MKCQSPYLLLVLEAAAHALAGPAAAPVTAAATTDAASAVATAKSTKCQKFFTYTANFDHAPTGADYSDSKVPFAFSNFLVDNTQNGNGFPINELSPHSEPNFAFLLPDGGSSITFSNQSAESPYLESFYFACTTLYGEEAYPAPCDLIVIAPSQFDGTVGSTTFSYPACDVPSNSPCNMTKAEAKLGGGQWNFYLASSQRYPLLLVDNVVLSAPNPSCPE